MANSKLKNALKDKVSIELSFPAYAGYLDYFLASSASIKIRNEYSQSLNLTVTITGGTGLLVPFEKSVEAPFESTVNVQAEGIFSPLYLAETEELTPCPVTVIVKAEGMEVCRAQTSITALPFDWWEGLEGNAERVAAFVRPRLAECAQILNSAGTRLKKWKADADFYGYTGADKNAVRNVAAAIYGAVKGCSFEKSQGTDLSSPCPQ